MRLPAEAFDCARLLHARVDNRARVSVRQCFYSVPARYAGRRLPVRLAARTVEVYDGPRLVAQPRTGGRTLRRGPVPGSLPRGPQDQTRWRCPERPRWHKPRPAACSPPRIRPTGTPPAAPAATPTEPAP